MSSVGDSPPRRTLELFDLTGRSALVTGASGALGAAASRALAGAGAHVTLAAGNVEAAQAIRDDIVGAGGTAQVVAGRADSPDRAEALVAGAVDAAGRLDIVVTASGVNIVSPTLEMSDADWGTVMDANVRGSWLVAQAAGRQLVSQGDGGKIVLVSSTRGKLGHPAGYSAYCPSKAAVDGLTRTLACEWGRHAINVNAIAPTVFRSALTAWMYADEDPGRSVRESMLSRIPLGRLGEPADFAGAVVFLGSRAADFVTGQILYVDGGYTAG
ncbi:MAG: SDR family NAD(P)-dependent oxidoreductase [Solirubrobacteraceae bacterium]